MLSSLCFWEKNMFGNGDDDNAKIMGIPVIKLTNPLNSLDVNDMITLDSTTEILETLIGSLIAHQDCGPQCRFYDKNMVNKLFLIHHALDELAEALAEHTGAYRMPANEERATLRSEKIYRKVSKLQGKSDADIESELIELRLAAEIESAKEEMHEKGEVLSIYLGRDNDGNLEKESEISNSGREGRTRSVSEIVAEMMNGNPQSVPNPRPSVQKNYRLAEKPMDKKFNA